MYSSEHDIKKKLLKRIIFLFNLLLIVSCTSTTSNKSIKIKERKYFSSSGFALIYNSDHFTQGVVKIDNEKLAIMHSFLKRNTRVRIINPNNSKSIETKISKIAKYPKIFNLVISEKIASILELDNNNPYIEVYEIKKNKKFVAKESNMFEEEKQVAESAPVDEIKMDDLSKDNTILKKKKNKRNNFILVISDFYYYDSANKLKNELIKKTQSKKINIKKINDNKYRLLVGPFKNFNALKTTYISLNSLGFEDLNIIQE